MMLKNMSIDELGKLDVKRMCNDVAFKKLIPDSCCECSNQKSFFRRLFKVDGIPEHKYAEDETQSFLNKYFQKQYKIKHIFFTLYKNQLIIDSAVCNQCQSTAITYDLSPEIMTEISNLFDKKLF